MLPDAESNPITPVPEESEIEPIQPEEAAAVMEQALQPYLDDGWLVLHQSPYIARLTREGRNLEIRVDLLGKVIVDEVALSPLQDSGRLIAWVLLLASLLVVLVLATVLGII
jgi:hypothetical protein